MKHYFYKLTFLFSSLLSLYAAHDGLTQEENFPLPPMNDFLPGEERTDQEQYYIVIPNDDNSSGGMSIFPPDTENLTENLHAQDDEEGVSI